jgi:hypothetical protein
MSRATDPSLSISERLKRRILYTPKRGNVLPTMYEAELADMIAHRAVRQLCIYQSPEGYSIKALPVWKNEFVTLIGYKTKEPRQYKSIDRLINTITHHGPLPPTLLLGQPPVP